MQNEEDKVMEGGRVLEEGPVRATGGGWNGIGKEARSGRSGGRGLGSMRCV